ncbi:MAG: hypothetical protein ABSG68_08700 [Thermoguttaceae bacterium]
MSDADLARAAIEKRQRGQRPAREELAALRRVQAQREDALRRQHFAAIRKREWREWSGRQDKILNEQATRYGLPIGGATIDLAAVVRWLHDFLARNARRLAGAEVDDAECPANSSPALERKRLADARRAELRYECEVRSWMPRHEIHAAHAAVASILRRAGESLLREFGAAAQKTLNDALDDCQREIDRRFADGPTADAPHA